MTNKKEEKPKMQKVWYIVENTTDIVTSGANFDQLSNSLEEALNDEIEHKGYYPNKKYAFKIELLGEVTQKVEIKKI